MSLETRVKKLEQEQSKQAVTFNDTVPFEPEAFYQDFGYLTHGSTGLPVEKLTDYQYETWRLFQKHKRILEVKSNKIGETTKWLMVDFQLAILPSSHPLSCRGYDQLLIAQTKDHAKQHLRDLRKMLIDSEKYSKYLINKPDEIAVDAKDYNKILRDEQSKTSVVFIHNPERPTRPGRIIALGTDNSGAILSWKNIKNIHMSDITASEGDYTPAINNAMTRLAITNGGFIIETIPGPPKGPIYDMWQKYRAVEWKEGYFKVVEVTAEEAKKAGVISQQFLDGERERLGALFGAFYGAQFMSVTGSVFKTEDIERAIQLGKEMAEKYGLNPLPAAYKSQGIDEGFSVSAFGICVVQQIDNILQVILAEEHKQPAYDNEVYDAAGRINTWPIQTTQCDAAQPAFIASLKRKIGEDPHYQDIDKEKHKFMKVKPIAFSTTHKEMLGNMAILMEKGWVAIHPKFEKLILALRTAVAEDYTLDKEKTAHNDVLDACRLALKPFSIGSRRYAV